MTAPRAAACPAAAASPGRLAAAAWDRVPISATTRNTSLTRLSWGVGVIENQSEDGCIQSQEEVVDVELVNVSTNLDELNAKIQPPAAATPVVQAAPEVVDELF